MVLNADLIRSIEDGPETHLTLTSGEKMVVRESVDEVMRRVIHYQQMLRAPHWNAAIQAGSIGTTAAGGARR